MQVVTERIRWAAPDDERSLLSWAADRASAVSRHLAPVVAVGRSTDGRLLVDVDRPSGTAVCAALDTLGTPTTGVAVTLTVPLLQLAVAERSGALQLGTAGLDDVLVDDAGAVLLCDRPPGAAAVQVDDLAGGCPADDPAAPTHVGLPAGAGSSQLDGAHVLLLAARVVWERTDGRDPVRPTVDAALAAALEGDVDAVRTALSVVSGAAAPRPVRWDPPPSDLLVGIPTARPVVDPARTGSAIVLDALRDLVERGVPLGAGRRVPLRRALVGAAVAIGTATSLVFALG
ncbi:hypothetical protein [Curtobacterium sp. L1-20]|uniref:hypothetical protein n=1 Tax=Curtobacterium sp. L1-20 TaxID=3138181 RepID=UPI003B528CBC